jgi:hypothetical protein
MLDLNGTGFNLAKVKIGIQVRWKVMRIDWVMGYGTAKPKVTMHTLFAKLGPHTYLILAIFISQKTKNW